MQNENTAKKLQSDAAVETPGRDDAPWSLSRKMMLSAAVIVFFTSALTTVMVLRLNLQIQMRRIEDQLSYLGTLVAANPLVVNALRESKVDKTLMNYLDTLVTGVTEVDVMALADMDERRIYYIDKSLLGEKFVGPDVDRVLRGESYFSQAVGSLGTEHRYLIPVVDTEDGRQVGFAMIGALVSTVDAQQRRIYEDHVRVFFLTLFLALVFAWLIARHIKKTLLGYEPRQLTKIYLERVEVLNSLEEGIVAADVKGRIKIANKAARSMLKLDESDIGDKKLDDLYPQIRITETLAKGRPSYNNGITWGDVNILCDKIPIKDGEKLLGAVAILRNRTELTRMAEELTGVNHMVDALRSNTHEFMNKLHVVLGLLRIGAPEDAERYITGVTHEQNEVIAPILQKIQNRDLAALLLGKMSHCRELDINFGLEDNSYVPAVSAFLTGNAFTTLVGNLVENAIEAVNAKPKNDGEREVTLLVHEDERSLMITVDDTGTGMTPEQIEHARNGGWSTKGRHRGTGMRLIASVLATNGGEMQIDSEKDVGTTMTVCFTRREKQ